MNMKVCVKEKNISSINEFIGNFILDKLGYIYTLKLIEKRIDLDIEKSKKRLEEIKENYFKITKENFLDNIKRDYNLNEYKKARAILKNKIEWKRNWKDEVYIEELEIYRNKDIIEVRNNYWKKNKNSKLFLILQEAILAPIYYELKKYEVKNLKENNIKRSAEFLSRYLNLKEEVGRNILSKTQKGIKEGNKYLNKGIKSKLIRQKMKDEKILQSNLVDEFINKVKDEALLVFMIKILNYIKYLKEEEEIEKIYKFKSEFIEFKVNYEREALFKRIKWNKNKGEIINFTYIKLIEI